MGDTESVDLGHSGLLNADTIPNANQSMNCFSCGELVETRMIIIAVQSGLLAWNCFRLSQPSKAVFGEVYVASF